MRIFLLTCIFAVAFSQYGPPPTDLPKIYEKDTPVTMLTRKNFEEFLFRGSAPILVQFISPMDEMSKALKDDYETLATTLGQAVKITAVDGITEREVSGSFGIESYPTFVFFGQDKSAPLKYDGEMRMTKIAQWTLEQLEKMMLTRLGIKKNKNKARKYSDRKRKDEPSDDDIKFWDELETPDVVELNESNFEETVMQSEDTWIVQFYSQKSRKSQGGAKIFSDMATEIKGEIKVGRVEASLYHKLNKQFEIGDEYPVNKFFPKDKSLVEDFVHDGIPLGGPMADSALDRLKFHNIAIKVPQIESHDEIAELCKQKKSMCVIAVLDDESQTEILKEQAKLNWSARVKIFWTPRGKNPELEKTFDMNVPGLVAFNLGKMTYYTMFGEYEEERISDFFNGITKNKFFFAKFEKFPKLNS